MPKMCGASPNGTSANAATAVMIEITGADEVERADRGDRPRVLLGRELDDLGERLQQPERADAVGPVAALEAPEQLALVDDHERQDPERDAEDHERLDDLDPPRPRSSRRSPSVTRAPPRRARRRLDGSGSTARGSGTISTVAPRSTFAPSRGDAALEERGARRDGVAQRDRARDAGAGLVDDEHLVAVAQAERGARRRARSRRAGAGAGSAAPARPRPRARPRSSGSVPSAQRARGAGAGAAAAARGAGPRRRRRQRRGLRGARASARRGRRAPRASGRA